jgi:radical SAM protein with 4Fe4S-binding SPASM domain
MGRPLALLTATQPRRYLPLAEQARAVDRKHRPRIAVWELTLRCNLACNHCGSRAGKARTNELTTEEGLKLVDELAELGTQEVSLIGGEAHLHPGFLTIVAALRAKGMLVSMATGGRAISTELAEAAARAGLASVSLSIDGLESTHDALRGVAGSFRDVVGAIETFRRAGVFVGANTQVNRQNLREIPQLLELLIEHGVRAWQVALTVAMGRAADRPELLLQPFEMLELMPMIAELKTRSDAAGLRLWPGNNIGYFGPHEATLRGNMPLGHGYSCGAGLSSLGIEADGTVKGCPSLPTEPWAGGNVREHPLREIWERSLPLRHTRDRGTSHLWGFCQTCYYADECRAGCTWTASALFGKPGNNPYCHHRALELERAGLRERVERVVAPPGEPFDTGLFRLICEPIPSVDSARTG